MKIDVYTKVVLTTIALCLVVLTIERLVAPNPTYAETMPRVIVSGVEYNVNGTRTVVSFKVPVEPASAAVPTSNR